MKPVIRKCRQFYIALDEKVAATYPVDDVHQVRHDWGDGRWGSKRDRSTEEQCCEALQRFIDILHLGYEYPGNSEKIRITKRII